MTEDPNVIDDPARGKAVLNKPFFGVSQGARKGCFSYLSAFESDASNQRH